MPTPLEQALLTLLPTHNDLPNQLLDLSASLLAQSRTVAARLKPDEEIGRTYACAHIACERLKTKYGFEKLVPRPPCPPKVYKKLYAYLEAALKSTATPKRDEKHAAIGTPGTGRSRGSTGKGRTSERTTRAKSGNMGVVPTPEILKRKAVHVEKSLPLPDAAAPLIEALCIAFEVPDAKSHIAAGAATVLKVRGWHDTANPEPEQQSIQCHASPSTPRKRRKLSSASVPVEPSATEGPITSSTLPALLVVITLHTIFKLRGKKISGLEYTSAKATAVSSLFPVLSSISSRESLETDTEIFLRAASTEGWLTEPWFSAIVSKNVDLGPEIDDVDDAEIPDVDNVEEMAEDVSTPKKSIRPAKTPLHRKEKHAPRPAQSDSTPRSARTKEVETRPGAGLVIGLGTMFQDSIDWLSADRRAEYAEWEMGIREQIAAIEGEAAAA